jgi:hypothetical protein
MRSVSEAACSIGSRGPVGRGFPALRSTRKPGAPGVIEGERRGAPGPLIPIVCEQGYTRITAQQALGNNALIRYYAAPLF